MPVEGTQLTCFTCEVARDQRIQFMSFPVMRLRFAHDFVVVHHGGGLCDRIGRYGHLVIESRKKVRTVQAKGRERRFDTQLPAPARRSHTKARGLEVLLRIGNLLERAAHALRLGDLVGIHYVTREASVRACWQQATACFPPAAWCRAVRLAGQR